MARRDTRCPPLGAAAFAPRQHGVPRGPRHATPRSRVTSGATEAKCCDGLGRGATHPQQRALVRCRPSWLLSCSALENLGHFYFPSNRVPDMSCTPKSSVSWSTWSTLLKAAEQGTSPEMTGEGPEMHLVLHARVSRATGDPGATVGAAETPCTRSAVTRAPQRAAAVCFQTNF